MAVTRSNDGESRARGAAMRHAGEQGLLFGDESLTIHSDDVGYRGPTACAAAGITYRQLDYWARTGLVEPTVRAAHGSGSQRLYSFRDICVLKVVKRLLDTGISLQQIRAAVTCLRDRGTEDLARLTLMSDGVTVYECTSTVKWWTCWPVARASSASRSAASGRKWTARLPSSRPSARRKPITPTAPRGPTAAGTS